MEGTRTVPGALGKVAGAVAALLLALTGFTATEMRTAAAATSCRARNATLATAAQPDLQVVLDAARSGDKIVITGICRGNFHVGVSPLTLEGRATADVPKAILDGNRSGSVLTGGTLHLKYLIIQNGYALSGGGIYASDVTLKATTVRWNTAAGASESENNNGGGICCWTVTLNMGSRVVHNQVLGPPGYYLYGGGIVADILTMNGNALVAWNYSASEGGGIYSYYAERFRLRGSSSVRGNTATHAGGGISTDVTENPGIVLSGSSTVTRNHAGDGGGIYGWDVVVLRDAASVIDNTAYEGGGIADTMAVRACAASSPDPWTGAISPNTPDDPPRIHYVTCL